MKSVEGAVSQENNFQHWPIYQCWITINLSEIGLGQVIISRINGLYNVAVGIFLIDAYCLGIKDCFVQHMDIFQYQDLLNHIGDTGDEIVRVHPVYANTLIMHAIRYAENLGFKPHSDFAKVKHILKDIDIDETLSFMFGKDGEPFYVQFRIFTIARQPQIASLRSQ